MHENQLTTPFVAGDRDVANNTHWHYGAANWRSVARPQLRVFLRVERVGLPMPHSCRHVRAT